MINHSFSVAYIGMSKDISTVEMLRKSLKTKSRSRGISYGHLQGMAKDPFTCRVYIPKARILMHMQ